MSSRKRKLVEESRKTGIPVRHLRRTKDIGEKFIKKGGSRKQAEKDQDASIRRNYLKFLS